MGEGCVSSPFELIKHSLAGAKWLLYNGGGFVL